MIRVGVSPDRRRHWTETRLFGQLLLCVSMLPRHLSPHSCVPRIFFGSLILAIVVAARGVVSAEVSADQVESFYRLGLAHELGREVDKDLFEAARQYRLAAIEGHAEAQFSLALILAGAVPNSPGSPEESFSWFREAAQRGHSRAAYFLALSYQTGAGVEPSVEKAFQWYRRSAKGGSAEAMNAMARMYESGEGISLNLANAYAWNEVASARGYPLAFQFRAKLEEMMSDADLARGKKLAQSLMKKYGQPASE